MSMVTTLSFKYNVIVYMYFTFSITQASLPLLESIHHPKNWNEVFHEVVVLFNKHQRPIEVACYGKVVECMVYLT